MKKAGRNDPCPCGSGKKFKKCCENTMIGKKFMAKKIDDTDILEKSPNLSSLFKKIIEVQKVEEKPVEPLESHSLEVKEDKEETDIPLPEKEEEKPSEEPSTQAEHPSSKEDLKKDNNNT